MPQLLLCIGIVVTLLVVIRHIVLSQAPYLVYNGYVFMVAIAVVISYVVGRDLLIALFVALLIMFGRLAYRYATPWAVLNHYTGTRNTLMFAAGTLLSACITLALRPYRGSWALHVTLLGMLMYLVASVGEWVVHRTIMHCYQPSGGWTWLESHGAGASSSWAIRQLHQTCRMHKTHHLSVNADMSLSQVKEKHELVFDWPTTAAVFACGAPLVAAAAWTLSLRVPLWQQALMWALMSLWAR
jgi:hypothetical protein